MFCKKCGNQLLETDLVCSSCGAQIDSEETTDAVPESAAEPDAVTEEKENQTFCTNCGHEIGSDELFCSFCGTDLTKKSCSKKSFNIKKFIPKGKVLAKILAAILAVILLVNIYSYAKNALLKAILSPEDYFAYIVKSNSKKDINTIANMLDMMNKSADKGMGSKVNIKFTMEEDAVDAIEDFSNTDIDEYIDWIENINLSYKANFKDDKLGADFNLKLNGTNLGNFKFVSDFKTGTMYMDAPDYTDTPVKSDIDDVDDYDEAFDDIKTLLNALPDKKTTKSIANRYIACIVENVSEVKESTETIKADGIEQKVTVLKVEIDEDLVKKISKSFFNELKNDDELREVIHNFAKVNGFDEDAFYDSIDSALESTDEIYLDDDIIFELYVNAKGEIAGFKLEDNTGEVNFFTTENFGKYGTVFEFEPKSGEYSGYILKFKGNGTTFFGRRTGEYSITVNSVKIAEIEVKNLDYAALEKGVLRGKITVSSPMIDDLSLTLDAKKISLIKSNYTLYLNYEDEKIATLKITSSTGYGSKVSVPNNATEADDPDDLEDWLEDFDFDKLIKRLEKANVPDDFIDELEDNIDDL